MHITTISKYTKICMPINTFIIEIMYQTFKVVQEKGCLRRNENMIWIKIVYNLSNIRLI